MTVSTMEETGDATPTRKWLILSVVLVGTFMAILDAFIVNVALPSIQRTIGAAPADLELVLASYSLLYAVFLITGGRLGDIFGRKKMFLIGMVIFTVSSAMCGLSPTPVYLIVSRAFQGFGSALMFPQILSIIQVTFQGEERALALGIFATVLGFASVVGQLLGGVLVQIDLGGLSWRPIFLVNLPIGIGGVISGSLVLRESKSQPPPKLDLVGVGLITLTLTSVIVPLVEGPALGWPVLLVGLLAFSLPFLGTFVLYERHRIAKGGYPLINVHLFSQRSFSIGLPLSILFFSTISGLFFMLSVFLQNGMGFSALSSGLTFTVIGVGFITTSLMSPRVVRRLGRYTLSVGYALVAIGLAFAVLLLRYQGPAIKIDELAVPLFVVGLGNGFGLSPLIGIVLAGARTEDVGQASGMLSTATQMGNAIGVAVYGLLFFYLLGLSSAETTSGRYVSSFGTTLIVLAVASVAFFGLVLGLPKPIAGRAKDILLERLPRPLSGLAYSFFFISGGRVGRQLFNEMLEGALRRRREEMTEDSEDSLADYVVKQFLGINREDHAWITYLIREALDSGGKFETLKDEREQLIRNFVGDMKARQEKGLISKDFDPEYLTLLLFAVSFYPRVFASATKTVTGLSPSNPEFERRWSQFLRELATRLQDNSQRDGRQK